MKKGFLLCVASIAIFSTIGSVEASMISNGDFEAGIFTAWNTEGDVRIPPSNVTYNDPYGMVDNYAYMGKDNIYGNSKLWQEFSIDGVDTINISFNWIFRSFHYDENTITIDGTDTFSASLSFDTSTLELFNIQSENVTMILGDGSNVSYGIFSQTIDVSNIPVNNLTLKFFLHEQHDYLTYGFDCINPNAMFGIDNVLVSSASPVPEPTTMILFGTGLAWLAGVARRKKKD